MKLILILAIIAVALSIQFGIAAISVLAIRFLIDWGWGYTIPYWPSTLLLWLALALFATNTTKQG